MLHHKDLGVLVCRGRANESITRALARLIHADLTVTNDIGLCQ